jgi:Spy/CpxP family protein refolding chaperone
VTRRTVRLAVAAFALSCAAAEAGPMGPRRGPGFLRQLFPPSLIMRQQGDIGLTAAQREAITKEMADAQKAVLDVRWQLEEKTAALGKLLGADKVDEAAALAQADEVVKLEDRLKRIRLAMMIRIKNLLTPAQQDALRKVQAEEPAERRGGMRGGDAMGSEGAEP